MRTLDSNEKQHRPLTSKSHLWNSKRRFK